MATRKTPSKKAVVASTTPVRNTPVPKVSATAAAAPAVVAARKPLAHESIARRAAEICASGRGGSDVDNWLRAEQELRAA